VRLLTRSTLLGVVAGIGLAAAPIAWSIGTHADPHALHLALVAGLLWLLVRWEVARAANPDRADRWLVAAAALTGLSVGNHSLTFLLGLPVALYVLAVEPGILRRGRFVALCAAALIIPTILVYVELPLRGGAIAGLKAPLVYGRPDTLDGFVSIVTGEQFRGGINNPFADLPRKVADLAAFAAGQLGPLALLVVPGFIVTAVRLPAYALLTGSALAITCFFNAAYVNAEIDRYYLGPALIAWTWLAVLAATVVDVVAGASARDSEPSARPRSKPFTVAAAALAGALLIGPTISALPDRVAIVGRSQDRGAEQWVEEVLSRLEQDAVVVSWWSYSTSLWYAQHIQGRRLDVFVVDDRTRLDLNLGEVTDVIDKYLGSRPVYVIRVGAGEISQLAERYTLLPLASPTAGNVFLVTARAAASADQ
jgi:hypothetical protein